MENQEPGLDPDDEIDVDTQERETDLYDTETVFQFYSKFTLKLLAFLLLL
mgnify:CR=1 FL=1